MKTTPLKAYKYCVRCGGNLENKGGNLLQCSQCSFKLFVNASPTASAIIVNEDGNILLAVRGIEPQKGTLDVIGGFMELNETFEQALLREVNEELGVDGEFIKYLGSYPEEYEFNNIFLPLINFVGLVKLKSWNIKPQDDVESIVYLTPKEITDAKFGFQSMKNAVIDYINKYSNV